MTRRLLVLLSLLWIPACGSGNSSDGGTPVTTCDVTSQCTEGRVCSDNACIAVGTKISGARCTASRDCISGLYCSLAGRCASGGNGRVGDACLKDDGCTAGLRCNYAGFTGNCVESGTGEAGDDCSKQTDCLSGLFCGADLKCGPYATEFPIYPGVQCKTDSAPFHSYFELPRPGKTLDDFYRLPYPNDARVDATGKLDLSDFPHPGLTPLGVDLVKLYTDATVADFDGFSTMAPIAFRFSQPIDYFGAFLSNALGNLLIIDLDTGAGLFATGFAWTESKSLYSCPNYLTVYPSFPTDHFESGIDQPPMKAGHIYGVLLLAPAIKAKNDGAAAAQDPDLAAVLAASRPTGDDVLGRAWDKYKKLRDYMAANQIAAASVANATVFTVADPAAHMRRLADAVAAIGAPALSDLFQCGASSGTDACDDGTAARKCGTADPAFVEIHGKMTMPIFQSGTLPYTTLGQGGINESGGTVSKVRDEQVCFALTVPAGSPPAGGWPLVVYSHGTGGSFRSFISDGVAAQMAAASPKTAVLSFDAVMHGARRGTSTRKPEELVFNVTNPRAARDNFLQGAADILTAFKLPRSTAPAGWSGPALSFNAAKLAFFGHSQGATSGALALPFTDDVKAAVLSGHGSNLSASLLAKKSPQDVKAGLSFLLSDELDPNHPLIALWQQFFDRSDPANYDRLLTQTPVGGRSPKNIFMTWGRNDTYSPADTLWWSTILLQASPLAALRDDGGSAYANLPPAISRPASKNLNGATAVVVQYDPPAGKDGHFVYSDVPAAVADWKAFLSSYLDTGTATVP